MSATTTKKLVRFQTVCEQFDLALQTGYNQVSRGIFPLPIIRIGKNLYCRCTDVDAFVESGIRISTPDQVKPPQRASRPVKPKYSRPGRPTKEEQIRAARKGAA